MALWTTTSLHLQCFPPVPEHVSMPWDAADDYLLQTLPVSAAALLFNDRQGALLCAMPTSASWIENVSSKKAALHNLAANEMSQDRLFLSSAAQLNDISGWVSDIVIRIPKNFEQLHYWLWLCAQYLPEGTPVWLAGMAKHIPVKWLNWLEQNCAGYEQFPQLRKARLLKITNGKQLLAPALWRGYRFGELHLQSLPGVFGRSSIDPGARFLTSVLGRNLSLLPESGTVCDLGCGNGVLGLWVKSTRPQLRIVQSDDHLPSVESARKNAQDAGVELDVVAGDCLESVDAPIDMVLCNPPFHDGHKQLDNIARNMFRQSADKLSADGKLVVVANRHLAYKAIMQRMFHSVELMDSDSKFNVWLASSPRKGNRNEA